MPATIIHAGYGDTIREGTDLIPVCVTDLLRQFFKIAFLMGKPQDLPPGPAPMQVGLILSFLTYVIALSSVYGIGRSMVHAAIDLGCSGLFLYLGLRLTNRTPRFEQAFAALCGAGAIVNLAAIPIFLNSESLANAGAAAQPGSLAVFSEFLLLVWSLSVFGSIMRHAFDIRMITSIVLAVCYLVLLSTLLEVFLPPAVRGAAEAQVSGIQPLVVSWLRVA